MKSESWELLFESEVGYRNLVRNNLDGAATSVQGCS